MTPFEPVDPLQQPNHVLIVLLHLLLRVSSLLALSLLLPAI
jgi:hypothetical protein